MKMFLSRGFIHIDLHSQENRRSSSHWAEMMWPTSKPDDRNDKLDNADEHGYESLLTMLRRPMGYSSGRCLWHSPSTVGPPSLKVWVGNAKKLERDQSDLQPIRAKQIIRYRPATIR